MHVIFLQTLYRYKFITTGYCIYVAPASHNFVSKVLHKTCLIKVFYTGDCVHQLIGKFLTNQLFEILCKTCYTHYFQQNFSPLLTFTLILK